MRSAAGLAVVTLVLLVAAPASALGARVTFGSSLSAAATNTYPKGADTAFWAGATPGGRAAAPAKGKIVSVRLKGCAVQNGSRPPLTQFHLQTLAPAGGSRVKVRLTSGPFNLPVCGRGGSAATVSTFRPVNLCAHRGDFVAFNDEGGFAPPAYPSGVPYQVLASTPGATTSTFTGVNRTNSGNTLTGHSLAGTELLMQMTLGTGRDAGVCRSF